ncbi:MAG: tetratricopeptide repeat protein [Rhodospirillaceae bacterium]|nr:tetratricopeptide repeat protein [Rhodospirillales bacterium]
MPLPGGAAAKAGISFEAMWTALQMLEVLEGRALSIHLEPPGVPGAEFVLRTERGEELHQVKLRGESRGQWSPSELLPIFSDFASFLSQSADRSCELITTSPLGAVGELLVRTSETHAPEDFVRDFVTTPDLRKAWTFLERVWPGLPVEGVVANAGRIRHRMIDPLSLAEMAKLRLRSVAPGREIGALIEPMLARSHALLTGSDIAGFLGIPFPTMPQGDNGLDRTVLPPANVRFTGREAELDALASIPESGRVVVHGLGGIGKTQVAVTLAHRFASASPGAWVVFVDAGSEASATRGLIDAGERMGVFGAGGVPQDRSAALRLVRRAFNGMRDWMFVVDDCPGPEEFASLFGEFSRGRIIVTSRCSEWSPDFVAIALPPLPALASRELLTALAGRGEAEAASGLADALGHLPLAIVQAGAYIRRCGIDLPDYLDRFKASARTLFGRPPLDYKETVFTTWRMSFAAAVEETPVAGDVLNLLAYFNGEGIPRWAIEQTPERLPANLAEAVRDRFSLDCALAALSRLSLVAVEANVISIHRLVQLVVREGQEDRAEWAEAAMQALSGAFPFDVLYDPAAWPKCEQLRPHAQALLTLSKEGQLRLSVEHHARLANQLGNYLYFRGDYQAAADHYRRAYDIDRGSNDADPKEMAIHANNVGNAKLRLDDLAGAGEWCRRALEIAALAEGSQHELRGLIHSTLGEIFRLEGRLEEGLVEFRAATRHALAEDGRRNRKVAIRIGNAGRTLLQMGRPRQALAKLRLALAIDLRQPDGGDHPNAAVRMRNIASALAELGRHAEALCVLERCIDIRARHLGDEHPLTVEAKAAHMALLETNEG